MEWGKKFCKPKNSSPPHYFSNAPPLSEVLCIADTGKSSSTSCIKSFPRQEGKVQLFNRTKCSLSHIWRKEQRGTSGFNKLDELVGVGSGRVRTRGLSRVWVVRVVAVSEIQYPHTWNHVHAFYTQGSGCIPKRSSVPAGYYYTGFQ